VATPGVPSAGRPAAGRPAAPAPPADLVISSRRVVTPGGIRPATVRVRGGTIAEVGPYEEPGAGPDGAAAVVLAGDEVLLPGLVDTHVHVNEPGRTDWEGFASATRAAAAGGITTIIDMPLNSIPPTTSAAALRVKRDAAAGQVHVDVGFWGGAVPGSTGSLSGLARDGAFGMKIFLIDSGVPEFPPLDRAGLEAAMEQAAALGSVVLVHAEDAAVIGSAPGPAGPGYGAFLRSRPAAAEVAAVAAVIDAARRTGARAHVLHLSAADAVPLLAAARRDGAAVTAETCPHYLALAAEDVPDGATEFKCCPPIRERANAGLLWAALRDGIIDCVVSDHSPCPPELKRRGGGDFGAAWGGISSVQLSLPVVWTAARRRGFGLDDVARWMAAGPARIAGLAGKGAIAPGGDGDLVAFAPDESFVVDPARLHHRHPVTPYAGARLDGVVRRAWLRGRPVTGGRPEGRLLARGERAR
jgi:allantoinase